ncbi:MAG: dTDP-4-dehydrorhamnose 3,5-epimerase [Chitinophagales bacterium]
MSYSFIEKTPIPDLLVINPRVWHDERGYFYESYNQKTFAENGLGHYQFVQDNQARSTYGVLRGLHYQLAPYGQAKLVRVTEGEILDVVVDLRKGSPTYGQHYGVVLSAANKKQLMVPRGFAHGYVVLSPTCEFLYKCDNFYNKAAENGLAFNDVALNIDWQVPTKNLLISAKDQEQPTLKELEAAQILNFNYSA